MAVVLGAAAPLLVGLFLKEADVIAAAQQILRVQLIGMPFVGIVLASTCIFQAIGNGAGAMILSAGRQGVIFAIVIFCASKLAGFSGVIASQPVSDFLTASVAVMILLQWKKGKNLQNKKEQQSGCGTAFRNGNLPQPLLACAKKSEFLHRRPLCQKARKSDEKIVS